MPGQQAQVEGRDSLGRNQPVGISDPVAATQALTLSGNAVAAETFTVGYQTYTWVTTLTLGAAGQVKVGVDAATSIVNATAAINGGGGGDTLFTAATPVNKFVTAVATSSTIMTVTAKESGAGPNAIPTTDTMSNASWGATTLAGGSYGGLFVDLTIGATQDVNLTKVGGSAVALGPALAAAAIPVLQASGVPHGNNLVASGTVTIPIGARDIGILLKTGTGTYTTAEGTPSLTLNTPVNFAGPISVAIVVTLANPGTADYNYRT